MNSRLLAFFLKFECSRTMASESWIIRNFRHCAREADCTYVFRIIGAMRAVRSDRSVGHGQIHKAEVVRQ